jgi:integrase
MGKKRGNREGTIMKYEGGWRGAVWLGYENGKEVRKYVRGKTRAEVVSKIKALVTKKEKHEPLSTTRRTVGQFINEWLEIQVKPNLSPSTYRGYEQTARMYIIPALGRIPLDRLTGKEVQECLNKMAEDGLSPTSVKNVNATLKSALSKAQKWGYIDRNAAKLATPPKQQKYQAHPLTVDQSERLLASVANHRWEALFYLSLMMGLRRGEVIGLRWSDIDFNVDFTVGMLHVRQSLQRIPKNGVLQQQVKSVTSRRHIPVPSACLQALVRRLSRQQEERKAAGEKWKQDGDFVFTSCWGGRIMPEEPTRQLDIVLKQMGIPHVRFHDLRHSTASLLIAKHVPMKVIQEILGHSTFQITADTYSHLVSNELSDAMKAMDDLFSKPADSSTPVVAGIVAGRTLGAIQ